MFSLLTHLLSKLGTQFFRQNKVRQRSQSVAYSPQLKSQTEGSEADFEFFKTFSTFQPLFFVEIRIMFRFHGRQLQIRPKFESMSKRIVRWVDFVGKVDFVLIFFFQISVIFEGFDEKSKKLHT